MRLPNNTTRLWVICALVVFCICIYGSLQSSAFFRPIVITKHVKVLTFNFSQPEKDWTVYDGTSEESVPNVKSLSDIVTIAPSQPTPKNEISSVFMNRSAHVTTVHSQKTPENETSSLSTNFSANQTSAPPQKTREKETVSVSTSFPANLTAAPSQRPPEPEASKAFTSSPRDLTFVLSQETPNCTEPTELLPWILPEKFDMPRSLSAGPLKNLIQALVGHATLPLIIFDANLLTCSENNAFCLPSAIGTEIFLATGNSCSQNLTASEAAIKLVRKPFTFFITLIDVRPNYWYLPSIGSKPESAFLPLYLTTWTSNGVDFLVPANISQFLRSHSTSKMLSCRRDIAKAFARDYPDFSDPSKAVITGDYILAMAHFRDLLYAHGMHPVLFGGTALGWYRNCDVIPYTTDIDFGVLASEWSTSAQTAIINDAKLTLYWILGKLDDIVELSVCSGRMKLDLFFLYLEEDKSFVGGLRVRQRRKLRWTYPMPTGFCSADLRGHLFLVPCNVEEFIQADYGPEWAKPLHSSKFNWFQSHYNVKETGSWPAAEHDSMVHTTFYTSNGTILQPRCR